MSTEPARNHLSAKLTFGVLILGSSDVTASESGESNTLPSLLRRELGERWPRANWRVEGALLYPTANMPARAEAEVGRVRPDAVFLSLGSNTFIEKTVMFSIRRRWRWAYAPAARIVGQVKGAAGGGPEGSASPRGAIFRLPRAMARRVFGVASMLEPEAALKATRDTFEMLAASRAPVVVRLAEGNVQQQDQREAAGKVTDAYNAAVRAMCERHGFPVFRLSEEMGDRYSRTPDGLHGDLQTRVHEVSRAADLIIAALGLAASGPRPNAANDG